MLVFVKGDSLVPVLKPMQNICIPGVDFKSSLSLSAKTLDWLPSYFIPSQVSTDKPDQPALNRLTGLTRLAGF